jgi:peptidoglycan/LPS O-acetylase OafA/YrhL
LRRGWLTTRTLLERVVQHKREPHAPLPRGSSTRKWSRSALQDYRWVIPAKPCSLPALPFALIGNAGSIRTLLSSPPAPRRPKSTFENSLSSPSSTRANGLDTLRAAAIALVFMNHYMAFVSSEPTFGWGSIVGWTGVDLFFALSGYLIANQLFAGQVRGQTLAPRLFYARRALRTLPAFWVVLALYFLFPAFMGGNTPPPLWRFLTFTQNWGLQPGTAFSPAWSLCIEEQFYLVLPLLLVAGARAACNRSQGWTLIAALLLVGVGARAVLWYSYGANPHDHYEHIYYSTLCRFDEFLPGVAVAMLKNFQRPLWQRITQHGQLWPH